MIFSSNVKISKCFTANVNPYNTKNLIILILIIGISSKNAYSLYHTSFLTIGEQDLWVRASLQHSHT